MIEGRRYGEGIENGNILVPISQFEIMNPSMQQDFMLVRTAKGTKMYVRNSDTAIEVAVEKHGIVSEKEWIGRQDPEYLQFINDVQYMVECLRNDYFTPQLAKDGTLLGWNAPKPTEDGDDFTGISIKADEDEDEDYLVAVAYTAFAELQIKAHPAIEHQFDTYWKLIIVD